MNNSNDKKIWKSERSKICSLPDAVLLHILSFLDMKEVMRTCLLSTRWKYLWVFVPVLNFNNSLWKMTLKDGTVKQKRFMNFVDRVLLLRDGSSASKLRIVCCPYCDSDRIDAWLTVAIRRQFHEVDLHMLINHPIELPRLIFSSPITVLTLDAKDNSGHQIEIPSLVCFSPFLKTLFLHNVVLPDGDSDDELVFTNPVLENLTFIDCYQAHLKVLNISTYRLKNLVFHNSNADDIGSCQIKICTPNLASIDFGGFWYENCCLGNLSSLVCAKFGFKSANGQCFVKILQRVSCPTTLQISSLSEDDEDLPGMLTRPFNNIRCLMYTGWGFSRRSNHYLLNLLEICPCLETLCLCDYSMQEQEEQCLFPITFDHLKYVDIQWLNVCGNELKLLEHLLKNAIILEKLTIRMNIPWDDLRSKHQFGDKIHSLNRASSKLTVLLL